MESVAGIVVGQVLVVRVLCDVVLIGKEWTDAEKLQNALAAAEVGQLVH